MNDLSKAVRKAMERLRESGLVAIEACDIAVGIFGGTSVRTFGEINVFEEGFTISLEGNGWIARVSGDGQLADEFLSGNLDSVVDFIVSRYEKSIENKLKS